MTSSVERGGEQADGRDHASPLGPRLAHLSRVALRRWEEAMAGTEATAVEYEILVLLDSGWTGAQVELAKEVAISPSSLSHHVEDLSGRVWSSGPILPRIVGHGGSGSLRRDPRYCVG